MSLVKNEEVQLHIYLYGQIANLILVDIGIFTGTMFILSYFNLTRVCDHVNFCSHVQKKFARA